MRLTGRVVKRGKDIAFLSGELVTGNGTEVAVAVATARIQAAG